MDSKFVERFCGYHKLLIKFGEITNDEFFSKENKMRRIFKFTIL